MILLATTEQLSGVGEILHLRRGMWILISTCLVTKHLSKHEIAFNLTYRQVDMLGSIPWGSQVQNFSAKTQPLPKEVLTALPSNISGHNCQVTSRKIPQMPDLFFVLICSLFLLPILFLLHETSTNWALLQTVFLFNKGQSNYPYSLQPRIKTSADLLVFLLPLYFSMQSSSPKSNIDILNHHYPWKNTEFQI